MHAFYQACLSFLFLARSPFCPQLPGPGPLSHSRLLLLNLFLEQRKARAPDPHAALPKAQVRMKARAGSGGSPPAAAAARRPSGGPGEAGAAPGVRRPGVGEVRRAE